MLTPPYELVSVKCLTTVGKTCGLLRYPPSCRHSAFDLECQISSDKGLIPPLLRFFLTFDVDKPRSIVVRPCDFSDDLQIANRAFPGAFISDNYRL